MSFFNRIFSYKRSKHQEAPESKESEKNAHLTPTPEYVQLQEFTKALNDLLMSDKYLARSDYKRLLEEYAELNSFFQRQYPVLSLFVLILLPLYY